jgi:hypothetical protein
VRAILRTTRQPIEIPKEAGMRKPLFRRTSFWTVLMEVAAASSPRYEDYSYRDRLDVYHATLAIESGVRLRQAVGLLKYTKLKEQVAGAALEAVDLYVIR